MPNARNGWLTLMAGGGCIHAAHWGVKSRISYFLCAEKVVVVCWLAGRIIECFGD